MANIVVIKMKNDFVNIPADAMKEEDRFIRVFCEGNLVGVFDMGIIEQAYLTVKKEK